MAYFDKYGVEFSDDKKTLVRCPVDFDGKYVIPNGVTKIADSAFFDCDFLENIVLPSSLQSIGNSAFNGCVGLKTITIPENVQQIGDAAFFATSITSVIWDAASTEDFQRIDNDEYGRKVVLYYWQIFNDDSIENISFGEGVKHIPAYLMHNQAIIELNLPDSIESIGDQAFSFCGNLNKIRIPKNLSQIGLDAFACIHINIEQQFRDELSSLTESQSVASLLAGIPDKYICRVYFDGLTSWCKTQLDSKDSNPLSSLGQYGAAYINGREAHSIMIDEGLGAINDYCFAGWTTINKVNLPSTIQRIGKYSFYKCRNLKTIVFNGEINEVELSAFNYCENIQLKNEYEHFKRTLFSIEDSPRHIRCKVYVPTSELNFGKYKSKSISAVIDKDVDYILWCLHHLDKFALSVDSLKLILKKHPSKWRALSVYAKFNIAPYELNSPYREMLAYE